MKPIRRRALLAAGLSLLSSSAFAGWDTQWLDSARSAWRDGVLVAGIEIDNDSLLMQDRDGFYSSGARVSGAYRLRGADVITTSGWRIGQELYTASDIKLPPERVGPPDRPYAGWIFGGLFYRIDHVDGRHLEVGLDVGCLGPCAGGEWTQNRLHSILDDPRPRAWSRQVGHEPGVVLHGKLAPVRWQFAPGLDLRPAVHARVGSPFTDAGVEGILRAGRLNRLPDEPTLHGFLRLDAKVVGYNATMQGRLFANDVHTVRPRRLIGEAEAGLTWNRMPVEAGVSVVRRSNEVRGLSSSFGAQTFARVHLRYVFK